MALRTALLNPGAAVLQMLLQQMAIAGSSNRKSAAAGLHQQQPQDDARRYLEALIRSSRRNGRRVYCAMGFPLGGAPRAPETEAVEAVVGIISHLIMSIQAALSYRGGAREPADDPVADKALALLRALKDRLLASIRALQQQDHQDKQEKQGSSSFSSAQELARFAADLQAALRPLLP